MVRESHIEKMGKIQDVSYEILNVLEFNRYVVVSFIIVIVMIIIVIIMIAFDP